MATNSGRRLPRVRFRRCHQLLSRVTGLLLLTFWDCGTAASAAETGPPAPIASFMTKKEAQARALAKKLELKVSPDVWAFFRTAQTGKASAVTNAFDHLKRSSSQYEGSKYDPTVGTAVWPMVIEVELAVEAFAVGDPKYSLAFGNGVINSIPPGSIYFGGTDAGRGLVTALCKSHAEADPFFTLTQNGLTDSRYLDYLRAMYGEMIRIPTTNDSERAFQQYLEDAQKRLAHDKEFPDEPRQIKPGEDVRIVNARVQVSGQMAVIAVRGLLAKTIFDANPDREFYLEESFPLDWMYPHLTPHKLIFKLNRAPLAELPEEAVKQDHEFWTQQQAQMIGNWLMPETPVKEVCAFAQKVFGRKDLSGFKGDRRFVENDYTNKLYSKLRSSIGGLYHWRVTNAKSAAERNRMTAEADFAFRQALAFCPRSPEVIFRHVSLLVAGGRLDDALRVAGTAALLEPDNSQLESLVSSLHRQKPAQDK